MSEIHDFGYRAPRYRADFYFLLQTDGPEARLLHARCRDISEDGLAAQIVEKLDVGTRVTLILTLPGNPNSIRIAAQISNRQDEDHGCVFLFRSLNERQILRDYLATLTTAPILLPRPSGQETR